MPDPVADSHDERGLFESLHVHDVPLSDICSAETRVKCQTASAADKLLLKAYHIQKHWSHCLSYEEFCALRHDMQRVRRVAIQRAFTNSLVRADIAHVNAQAWVDLRLKPQVPLLKKMDEIAQHLKLANVLDQEASFMNKDVAPKRESIKALCGEVASLLHLRLRGNSIRSMLSMVWREVFGATIACTARKRNSQTGKREPCYSIRFPRLCGERSVLDYALCSNFFTPAQPPVSESD